MAKKREKPKPTMFKKVSNNTMTQTANRQLFNNNEELDKKITQLSQEIKTKSTILEQVLI